MTKNDAVVAVFARHGEAEAAIRKLAESGLASSISALSAKDTTRKRK